MQKIGQKMKESRVQLSLRAFSADSGYPKIRFRVTDQSLN